ncbi:MAG: hypothetical protein DWQ04_27665 [Chloroflexi bacterium]|nr:MAG: hypothetical protein DWQ04_27665 [Chloroflexota bacterium]
MPNLRVWERYPQTYRADEMRLLTRWIATCESGTVIGLPGCGRSTLLNFLCHRPDIVQGYLPPETGTIILVPIDLNHLPSHDPITLYLVILRAIYWVRHRFPSHLQETIVAFYQEYRPTQSPFLAQSGLHELLFALQEKEVQLVLALNHFDRFTQSTRPQTLDTLRGLRDSFRDTLCFIAGMTQEAAYLSDAKGFTDTFSGLLLYQICWVGAMNEADARWVINQTTYSAPQSPTTAEVQTMLTLSGGFPSLLRAIGLWWLNQSDKPSLTDWHKILITEPVVEQQLTKLWHGLTQIEQFTLATIHKRQQPSKHKKSGSKGTSLLEIERDATLRRLAEKGLCFKRGPGWQMRGKLLAAYIEMMGPVSRGGLRLDSVTNELFQGETLVTNLTPQERTLLSFMLQHEAHKEHEYETLLNEVWTLDEQYDKTIMVNNVQQLVSGLRKKIEEDSSNPRFIISWGRHPRGGYKLYPEGRPEQ